MSRTNKPKKEEIQQAAPAGDTPGSALGQALYEYLDTLQADKVYEVTFTYSREGGIHLIRNFTANYRGRA